MFNCVSWISNGGPFFAWSPGRGPGAGPGARTQGHWPQKHSISCSLPRPSRPPPKRRYRTELVFQRPPFQESILVEVFARIASPTARIIPTVVKFFVGWYPQVGKSSSDLISGPGNIAWGSISEQIVSLLTCRDLNAYWVVTVCIGCVLSGDLE